MAGELGEGEEGTGIVVAIRESGAETATAKVSELADAFESLSPRFASRLRGKALRLGANLQTEVKKAAKVALEKIVRTTPHDTGKARANWVVSVTSGGPDTTTTEDTDYDGDATIARESAKMDATKMLPGQAILISNSLPYIRRLNEGFSQQAPAAFVERAVQAGIASIKQGARDVFGDKS